MPRLVVVHPASKGYSVYEGRKCLVAVQAGEHLTREHLEGLRLEKVEVLKGDVPTEPVEHIVEEGGCAIIAQGNGFAVVFLRLVIPVGVAVDKLSAHGMPQLRLRTADDSVTFTFAAYEEYAVVSAETHAGGVIATLVHFGVLVNATPTQPTNADALPAGDQPPDDGPAAA